MHSYNIKENFIATESQREFRLNKPFVQGTINVYVNGALQSLGSESDYITLADSGKIIFNRNLSEGDVVSIITNKTVEAIKVMSYGKRDTSNALYQKYNSAIKLNHNNRYKIHVLIDDKSIDWSFSTVLTPYWTSVKKIHEDIGEFIQGFTDEYIASMIHRNSWELLKRIQEAMDDDEASEDLNENAEAVTTIDSSNEYVNTWRVISNWVRYKTEIDLIYARYFGISFRYGTQEKTIGDISVKKETKLPYIDNLLARLNDLLDNAEDEIFGSNNFAVTYQKGSTNYSYDDIGRTVNWSS